MMKDGSGPQRGFSRVAAEFEVTIAAGRTVIVPDHTTDISMNGMFVHADSTLPVGTNCTVTIHLGDRDGDTRIEAYGRVARTATDGLAVEFLEIGLDSYDHLKHLVRYNTEQLAQVEQELESHLGLK